MTTGHLEKDHGQHDATAPTALAHGAAMLVPRRLIQQVGLMPALYFLYYEELDWCEMMKRAGVDEDYKARATKERHEAYEKAGEKVAVYQRFLQSGELPLSSTPGAGESGQSVIPGDSDSLADFCLTLKDENAKAHYEKLLQIAREKCPLVNASTAPIRPHLPM